MMKQKTNLDGLVKRVTCLICGICFCFGIYAQQQKPFVIPELKEWKGETGFFTPKQSVRIICDDPDLQKVARQFAATIRHCTEYFRKSPEESLVKAIFYLQ